MQELGFALFALQELGTAPQIAIALAIVTAVLGGVIMLFREMRRSQLREASVQRTAAAKVDSQRDLVTRADLDGLKKMLESIKPPPVPRPAMDTMRPTCAQHNQLTAQIETMVGDLAETRVDTQFMRKDISALKVGQERILDHLTNSKDGK